MHSQPWMIYTSHRLSTNRSPSSISRTGTSAAQLLPLHTWSPTKLRHRNYSRPSQRSIGDEMKSFAAVALALLFVPASLAQSQTFSVNPDGSEVRIRLNTTHEVVNGTFHIRSGSIEFDRGSPKMSSSVTVSGEDVGFQTRHDGVGMSSRLTLFPPGPPVTGD